MKKFIYLIVVLVTLGINIYPVNGAGENVVIEKRHLENGDFEMVLTVDPNLEACGGNLTFTYSKDEVTIDNIMVIDDQNYVIAVNDHYNNEDNKIRVSFASSKVIQGKILIVSFKNKEGKSDKDTSITISECVVTDANLAPIESAKTGVTASKGDSLIDNTMKKYDENNDDNANISTNDNLTNDKSNDETTKKETKNSTKKSTNYTPVIIAGGVGIVAIVLVIKKMKN